MKFARGTKPGTILGVLPTAAAFDGHNEGVGTMTTATLHSIRTAGINAAMAGSPARQLTWSLAASAGLTAVILGVGFVYEICLCSSPAVCWGLVSASILGTHLTSRNVPWGWLLLVSLQPMWVVYALATEQYGFIVGSIACGLGQLNGFLRSRRGASREEGRS